MQGPLIEFKRMTPEQRLQFIDVEQREFIRELGHAPYEQSTAGNYETYEVR